MLSIYLFHHFDMFLSFIKKSKDEFCPFNMSPCMPYTPTSHLNPLTREKYYTGKDTMN